MKKVGVQDLKPGMSFDAMPIIEVEHYTFGLDEHDDAVMVAAENVCFKCEGVNANYASKEVTVYAHPFNLVTRWGVEAKVYC